MMKIIIISLLAAAALMQLGSCSTPLDLDTPRIDSLVSATVKLRTMTVMMRSGRTAPNPPIDTMAIGSWRFVQDTLYFRMSRTGDPPSTSFYARFSTDRSTSSFTSIDSLHVRLVNIPVRDSVELTGDPARNETGVHMQVSFGTRQFSTSHATRNFTAKAKLTYSETPARTIQGTVEVMLQTTGNQWVKIVAAIEGSE